MSKISRLRSQQNMRQSSAADVIAGLDLRPHPEGGFYRETYRDRPADGSRGALSVIYYLLRQGEQSTWHRIDATEVWHYYAGAPLELVVAGPVGWSSLVLGNDFPAGEVAHGVVSPGAWQTARSLGDWTLVGCTVAPAFEFAGFELAPPDWTPPQR
jgi:predicted cupin superfamily sugar epimerase